MIYYVVCEDGHYKIEADEMAWGQTGHTLFMKKSQVLSQGGADPVVAAAFPPNINTKVLNEENYKQTFGGWRGNKNDLGLPPDVGLS